MKKTILLILAMIAVSLSMVSAYFTNDLSATDVGNWIGTANLIGTYIHDNGYVYVVGQTGEFGYYNPSTNSTIDLSSNLKGICDGQQLFDIDGYGDDIFIVGNNGCINIYHPSTNITEDLSATDSGDFINNEYVLTVSVSHNGSGDAFVGGGDLNTVIAYYSSSANNTINIVDSWINGAHVYSSDKCVVDNTYDLSYFGADGGLYGVYSIFGGGAVLIDFSSSDTGNWVGTSTVNSFSCGNDRGYLGTSNGKFGYLDPLGGVSTSLSLTDEGNFIGSNSINGMTYIDDEHLFLITSNGLLSSYNFTTNTTILLVDLPGTSNDIDSISNETIYIVGNSGLFYKYNEGQPEINTAPTIDDFSPVTTTFSTDTTQIFVISASDPENDSLAYSWYINGSDQSESSASFSFFDSVGVYNVTAYVSDGSLTDSQTWIETIIAPSTSGGPSNPPVESPFLTEEIEQAKTQPVHSFVKENSFVQFFKNIWNWITGLFK